MGLVEGRDIGPDGVLRRGDTILAFMPKKLYLEKYSIMYDAMNGDPENYLNVMNFGESDTSTGRLKRIAVRIAFDEDTPIRFTGLLS